MKLTVYTSKKCPRCKALKKWLRAHSLSFKEKNIGDTEIMASLVMRNIFVLSAPALEIGDKIFLSDQIFQENNSLQPSFIKVMEMKK